jgi:hypothetical protein
MYACLQSFSHVTGGTAHSLLPTTPPPPRAMQAKRSARMIHVRGNPSRRRMRQGQIAVAREARGAAGCGLPSKCCAYEPRWAHRRYPPGPGARRRKLTLRGKSGSARPRFSMRCSWWDPCRRRDGPKDSRGSICGCTPQTRRAACSSWRAAMREVPRQGTAGISQGEQGGGDGEAKEDGEGGTRCQTSKCLLRFVLLGIQWDMTTATWQKWQYLSWPFSWSEEPLLTLLPSLDLAWASPPSLALSLPCCCLFAARPNPCESLPPPSLLFLLASSGRSGPGTTSSALEQLWTSLLACLCARRTEGSRPALADPAMGVFDSPAPLDATRPPLTCSCPRSITPPPSLFSSFIRSALTPLSVTAAWPDSTTVVITMGSRLSFSGCKLHRATDEYQTQYTHTEGQKSARRARGSRLRRMRPRRLRGHPPCWSACPSFPCSAPRHNNFDSTSLAATENPRDSRLHRPPPNNFRG